MYEFEILFNLDRVNRVYRCLHSVGYCINDNFYLQYELGRTKQYNEFEFNVSVFPIIDEKMFKRS